MHAALSSTCARLCVFCPPSPFNKCLVIYGVSRRGVKSSQVRLTGGSKWKRADVGGYYVPLKQQKDI